MIPVILDALTLDFSVSLKTLRTTLVNGPLAHAVAQEKINRRLSL